MSLQVLAFQAVPRPLDPDALRQNSLCLAHPSRLQLVIPKRELWRYYLDPRGVYTYIHMHIYIQIHMYVYIYIHTYTHGLGSSVWKLWVIVWRTLRGPGTCFFFPLPVSRLPVRLLEHLLGRGLRTSSIDRCL